jgi:uncharacterized membrane protein (DUF4010 family)
MRDGLPLLMLALLGSFIVPDVRIGPYGAIQPQALVRLIAIVLVLTKAGQVAQALFGTRFGLAITGFVGGFVSSSATIGFLSALARRAPDQYRHAVAGALASNIATILLYVVIVGALDLVLLGQIAGALTCATLVSVLLASSAVRSAGTSLHANADALPRLSPWHTLLLALVFSLVSLVSAALHERFGGAGIVVVSMIAGIVDAHSTAGSLAALHRAGSLDASTAELAIVIALSANSLTKVVMAFSGRHFKFALLVTTGILAVVAAAWLGVVIQ